MHVPFLDLKIQYESIRGEVAETIARVLDSAQYILGPEASGFENAFASLHAKDVQHPPECIGTNNGTSALHLALWAMGIKAGDEVLVPTNTFIATAEAVLLAGATPVFVDHDDFYGMNAEDLEAYITPRTRAIIAVHLYGQIANMEVIRSIADHHGLFLIEDAAQAHLASLGGKVVGAWGAATAFSFYPGKNLGAYGEAGAILTSDAALAEKMRRLRDHGSKEKYTHVLAGHNYRIEALQAAVLRTKLPHLDSWTEARRNNADRYREALGGISEISLPNVRENARHVYHLFVIEAEDREGLRDHLAKHEISTGLHYPIPLHLQPCFADPGHKEGAFPRAETAAKKILSLPMYPELRGEQIEFVGTTIKQFYAKGVKAK